MGSSKSLFSFFQFIISKMNKNTIIILVTVVISLIIGAAYLMLSPTTPHKDQSKETPEEIGASEKEVNKTYRGDLRFEISEEELNINAKLLFKVGDEFEYHSISKNTDIHYLYIVEEIKIIYGRDYYAIRTKGWGKQKFDKLEEIPKGEGRVWLYYDKVTGEAFKMDETIGYKLKNLGNESLKVLFVEYWMLALDDNFKWTRMWNTTGLGVHYESKYMYEVVEREKIKGRDCFKVEKKIMNLKSNEIIKKTILWVDIETRVFIKRVAYEGDIKIVEEVLVSAPFLK